MSKQVLLLLSILTAVYSDEKLTFIQEYNGILNDPIVVKSGDDLITLEYSNESIRIYASYFDPEKCEIKLDREFHKIDIRIKAKSLGNGKIVIYGSRPFDENNHNRTNLRIYVGHVIDPISCTKNSFSITVGIPLTLESKLFGSLVPYHDTFDFFFPGSHIPECNPCRFNDNGEQIQAPFIVGKKKCRGILGYSYIRTIKDFDPSEGYFAACSLKNDTGALRLINSKFNKLIRYKEVDHPIYDVAVAKGDETHIGICYEQITQNETTKSISRQGFCEILDTDFKPKHTIKLNIDDQSKLGTVKILILKDGSAWIANSYIMYNNEEKSFYSKIFVHHIQIDGKTSGPVEFLKIMDDDVQLHQMIIKNSYCLFIADSENFMHFDLHGKRNWRLRCIDENNLSMI